eukprot:SAG11_NODE_26110_length_349_cov_1.680000_1_plen_48_part_01
MDFFLSIKSQRIHMCVLLVYTIAVQRASISKMRSVKSTLTCRVIGINF